MNLNIRMPERAEASGHLPNMPLCCASKNGSLTVTSSSSGISHSVPFRTRTLRNPFLGFLSPPLGVQEALFWAHLLRRRESLSSVQLDAALLRWQANGDGAIRACAFPGPNLGGGLGLARSRLGLERNWFTQPVGDRFLSAETPGSPQCSSCVLF